MVCSCWRGSISGPALGLMCPVFIPGHCLPRSDAAGDTLGGLVKLVRSRLTGVCGEQASTRRPEGVSSESSERTLSFHPLKSSLGGNAWHPTLSLTWWGPCVPCAADAPLPCAAASPS